MKDLKYSEILRLNKEIGANLRSNPYNIIVLSNIIVHQIKEVLEYQLRIEGINANVVNGDYDNIVQDSLKYKESDVVIIFWELCNIIDGLQFKIDLLDDDQLNTIFERTKSEVDLVLKNLRKTSLILLNKFTSLPFSISTRRKNNLEELHEAVNEPAETTTDIHESLIKEAEEKGLLRGLRAAPPEGEPVKKTDKKVEYTSEQSAMAKRFGNKPEEVYSGK